MEKLPLFTGEEPVSGRVIVKMAQPGKRVEHQGIKIEFIGQIRESPKIKKNEWAGATISGSPISPYDPDLRAGALSVLPCLRHDLFSFDL